MKVFNKIESVAKELNWSIKTVRRQVVEMNITPVVIGKTQFLTKAHVEQLRTHKLRPHPVRTVEIAGMKVLADPTMPPNTFELRYEDRTCLRVINTDIDKAIFYEEPVPDTPRFRDMMRDVYRNAGLEK